MSCGLSGGGWTISRTELLVDMPFLRRFRPLVVVLPTLRFDMGGSRERERGLLCQRSRRFYLPLHPQGWKGPLTKQLDVLRVQLRAEQMYGEYLGRGNSSKCSNM